MKAKYFYILIAFSAISFSLNAQTKKAERFVQLVNKFNQAIISTDSTTLNNLVWEDLSYGHSSGAIQDKTAFISGVMKGPNFFKKFELQNQTVKISGKNAIVRHLAIAQAVNKGNPVEIRFGNILVWQKKKGQWKLLARQGYKL